MFSRLRSTISIFLHKVTSTTIDCFSTFWSEKNDRIPYLLVAPSPLLAPVKRRQLDNRKTYRKKYQLQKKRAGDVYKLVSQYVQNFHEHY